MLIQRSAGALLLLLLLLLLATPPSSARALSVLFARPSSSLPSQLSSAVLSSSGAGTARHTVSIQSVDEEDEDKDQAQEEQKQQETDKDKGEEEEKVEEVEADSQLTQGDPPSTSTSGIDETSEVEEEREQSQQGQDSASSESKEADEVNEVGSVMLTESSGSNAATTVMLVLLGVGFLALLLIVGYRKNDKMHDTIDSACYTLEDVKYVAQDWCCPMGGNHSYFDTRSRSNSYSQFQVDSAAFHPHGPYSNLIHESEYSDTDSESTARDSTASGMKINDSYEPPAVSEHQYSLNFSQPQPPKQQHIFRVERSDSRNFDYGKLGRRSSRSDAMSYDGYTSLRDQPGPTSPGFRSWM